MTKNQIDYRNLEENRRHNREMERLTGEKQAEDARHNLATEQELTRHQQEVESETRRSNQAHETISAQTNVVNQTHYERSDAEQRRHNIAQENIQSADVAGQNELRASQSAVNYVQADYVKGQTQNLPGENLRNLSSADLNYAKVKEALTKAALNEAQTASVRVQTQYEPGRAKSEILGNITKSLLGISGEVRQWLNPQRITRITNNYNLRR